VVDSARMPAAMLIVVLCMTAPPARRRPPSPIPDGRDFRLGRDGHVGRALLDPPHASATARSSPASSFAATAPARSSRTGSTGSTTTPTSASRISPTTSSTCTSPRLSADTDYFFAIMVYYSLDPAGSGSPAPLARPLARSQRKSEPLAHGLAGARRGRNARRPSHAAVGQLAVKTAARPDHSSR